VSRFLRLAACGLVLTSIFATPLTLSAQRSAGTMPTQQGGKWTVVRTAKWALLGGAVGLGAYALHHSFIAERSYGQLREFCFTSPERCEVMGGRYVDQGAEALFARSISADRHAQVGIFGGQVALLGSVGLFIYDLRNGQGPRDIPYPAKRGVGVGMSIPF
jgi:hypothetical protein